MPAVSDKLIYMGAGTFSLVAYLPGEMGKFVDSLRKRLNPDFADWLAHVTILPPRPLGATPEEALALIRQKCLFLDPFQASLGRVLSFWPVKGVVYLSFTAGFQGLVDLHDLLNWDGLAYAEPYSHVPHVTVAQELDEASVGTVLEEITREWARYGGEISLRIESLSLVRQEPDRRWVDLGPIQLGRLLEPSRR